METPNFSKSNHYYTTTLIKDLDIGNNEHLENIIIWMLPLSPMMQDVDASE